MAFPQVHGLLYRPSLPPSLWARWFCVRGARTQSRALLAGSWVRLAAREWTDLDPSHTLAWTLWLRACRVLGPSSQGSDGSETTALWKFPPDSLVVPAPLLPWAAQLSPSSPCYCSPHIPQVTVSSENEVLQPGTQCPTWV